MELKT